MFNKLWENRLEFYPYFSILFFWFFGCFISALMVKNRPGIITLGIVTIPSITLILIAITLLCVVNSCLCVVLQTYCGMRRLCMCFPFCCCYMVVQMRKDRMDREEYHEVRAATISEFDESEGEIINDPLTIQGEQKEPNDYALLDNEAKET